MKRFERIQQLLEEAVGPDEIGAHGRFWLDVSLDNFKKLKVFGQQLLIVGNADDSNLIKALEGRAPFDKDPGTPTAHYRRMPAGRPPMPPERIAYIRKWIADSCPDEEETVPPGATV